MVKKLLAAVLAVSMMFGLGTTAFATEEAGMVLGDENESLATTTGNELLDELNAIDFDKEVTFTALPQSRLSDQELLNFDSVEAAEAYLKQLMVEQREFTVPTGEFVQNQTRPLFDKKSIESRAGWHYNTVYWWGGGNSSLLSMTNAEIKFYYNNSSVSKISVSNSYMTGLYGATWTHRYGSGTPVGGKKAKFSVTGTWFIGLSIGGFPIGASFNETLKSPTITLKV